MVHYAKSSLEYEPNLIILHCGTHDLRGEKEPSEIANDIATLCNSIKNDRNEVIISGITRRTDRYGEKANIVNKKLKSLCNQNNIDYIDNSNLLESHLNRDGLHLNYKGTFALGHNFINAIAD